MTTLAQQLRKLAVRTEAGATGTVVARPSLLFTQREAASLDTDDIYELGVNGLLELAATDERFAAFQETLFSAQARRLDREGQTPEENRKLNALIADLLLLLSPHFMQRAAHKVLEWLLRRFLVHRFNLFDLVACTLPFHETVVWARLVQLLPVADTAFAFLEGVKRSGAPLPRPVLIERCVTPGGIDMLDFVYQVLNKSTKRGVANRPLCSLWAALCVGSIRLRPTETTVQATLPLALGALRAPDAQLWSAALMIVAQLSRSVQLASDAAAAIAAGVAPLAVAEREAMLVMCGLCAWQQSALKGALAGDVSRALLAKPKAVVDAHSAGDASALVQCLLGSVVAAELGSQSGGGEKVLAGLWEAALPSLGLIVMPVAAAVVCATLVGLARGGDPLGDADARRLWRLWKPLGRAVSDGVAAALHQSASDKALCARVERMGAAVSGPGLASHSPLPGTGVPVLLALADSRAAVRLQAVQAIDREVQAGRLAASHELGAAAALLVGDVDDSVARAALACAWLPAALPPAALWQALQSSLELTAQPSRTETALCIALQLPGEAEQRAALAAALRLCATGDNGCQVAPHVARACLASASSNTLIAALGKLAAQQQPMPQQDVKQPGAKRVRKDAAHGEGTPLAHALASACAADWERAWSALSTHLPSAPLMYVCALLLRRRDDTAAHGVVVTAHALHLLRAARRAAPTAAALELAGALSACGVLGDSDQQARVFASLAWLTRDGQCVDSLAVFLARVPDAMVLLSALWSVDAERGHTEQLVVCRALQVGEVLLEARSDSPHTAQTCSDLLASLLVPLQSSHKALRKAALRCVARMARAGHARCAGATAALLQDIRAAAAAASVKQSSDGLALVLAGVSGSRADALLTWTAQQLARTASFVHPQSYALVRATRLVWRASRVELFLPRLRMALEMCAPQATLLLQSFANASAPAALARPTNIGELLCNAMQHADEDVAQAALRLVSGALWNALGADEQRTLLGGLCAVVASSGAKAPERAQAALRVTRDVGAVRGDALIASLLRFHRPEVPRSAKKARSVAAAAAAAAVVASSSPGATLQGDDSRVLDELARLEVVLELVRASNGGDAGTASALVALLQDLSALHDVPAADYTVQAASVALTALVGDGRAQLGDADVGIVLDLLATPQRTPNLRKALLQLLDASAQRNPQAVAARLLPLLTKTVGDDRGTFLVLRSVLDRVFPHVASDDTGALLTLLVGRLADVPAHRRAILLVAAAHGLPTRPLADVLARLLQQQDALPHDEARDLACGVCAELGPLATIGALHGLAAGGVSLSAVAARFMADALTSQWFVDGMLALDTVADAQAQDLLSAFFEQLLGSVVAIAAEQPARPDAAATLDALHEALTAVNELFTLPHFLRVVKRLLRHPNNEARRRVLLVLNERTLNHRPYLKAQEEKRFIKLLPRLARLTAEADADEALVQGAVVSLETLGRAFADAHPDEAVDALECVLGVAAASAARPVVLASALLSSAQLAAQLGPRALPHVGQLVQLSCSACDMRSPPLALAALAALLRLVDALGALLAAAHIEAILSATLGNAAVLQHTLLAPQAVALGEVLARSAAPRLLALALQPFVSRTVSAECVTAAVRVAALAAQQTSRPADLRLLWTSCSAALYRTPALPASASHAAAEAMADVAFHLSEAEFRPLLAALIESASNATTVEHGSAVYEVFSALLRRLKAIAVPWVCRLGEPVAQSLARVQELRGGGRLDEGDVESVAHHVRCALNMMQLAFGSDGDSSISKDVHTALLDAIVACLESEHTMHDASLCLLEMVSSMGTEALWRPLNHAVLLRVRHSNAAVRMGAVRLQADLWRRMGEAWLSLLPDTLPFLGEVMEDDHAGVVKEAQRLRKLINSFLPPDEGIAFE